MRGIARLGDSTHGTCYKHESPIKVGGKIISASADTTCNNRGIARLGDTTSGDYISTIISASPDSTCN